MTRAMVIQGCSFSIKRCDPAAVSRMINDDTDYTDLRRAATDLGYILDEVPNPKARELTIVFGADVSPHEAPTPTTPVCTALSSPNDANARRLLRQLRKKVQAWVGLDITPSGGLVYVVRSDL
jgi:hypothetical protein